MNDDERLKDWQSWHNAETVDRFVAILQAIKEYWENAENKSVALDYNDAMKIAMEAVKNMEKGNGRNKRNHRPFTR